MSAFLTTHYIAEKIYDSLLKLDSLSGNILCIRNGNILCNNTSFFCAVLILIKFNKKDMPFTQFNIRLFSISKRKRSCHSMGQISYKNLILTGDLENLYFIIHIRISCTYFVLIHITA